MTITMSGTDCSPNQRIYYDGIFVAAITPDGTIVLCEWEYDHPELETLKELGVSFQPVVRSGGTFWSVEVI